MLIGKMREVVKDTPFETGFEDAVKELKTLDDISKLLEMIYEQKSLKNESEKSYLFAIGSGGGKVIPFDISVS